MSGWWLVSHLLLWLLNLALLLLVAATIRQVGLIHLRIPPVGARMGDPGPAIGDEVPPLEAIDLNGRKVTLLSGDHQRSLLLFMSASCDACSELAPSVPAFARGQAETKVIIVYRGDESTVRESAALNHLRGLTVVASADLHEVLKVSAFPYGILISKDGKVVSKGVVNHLEHLESLTDAAEVGFESVEALVTELDRQHRVHENS